MKSIFIDLIYKCVSYYKYQQKQPLKGAMKNKCSVAILEHNKYCNDLNVAKILEKYVWRSSFLVKLQVCRLIANKFNK